jgi:tetratricopeptide (TPR) repeat protein
MIDLGSDLERARLLFARGSVSEAAAALERILAEQPAHLDALLLMAALLLDERRGTEALVLLERAVAVAPGSAAARNGLARGLHALGRDDAALAAALEARRLLPEGDNQREAAPVYLTLVWCLRELRRYREALAVAEEGLARTPDAVLAQWASVVEEELEAAEREEC